MTMFLYNKIKLESCRYLKFVLITPSIAYAFLILSLSKAITNPNPNLDT